MTNIHIDMFVMIVYNVLSEIHIHIEYVCYILHIIIVSTDLKTKCITICIKYSKLNVPIRVMVFFHQRIKKIKSIITTVTLFFPTLLCSVSRVLGTNS